jgi:hypothetical protein
MGDFSKSGRFHVFMKPDLRIPFKKIGRNTCLEA